MTCCIYKMFYWQCNTSNLDRTTLIWDNWEEDLSKEVKDLNVMEYLMKESYSFYVLRLRNERINYL